MGAGKGQAGTFVVRRGGIGAGAASGAGGLVGAAIASKVGNKQAESPLDAGEQMGYLALGPDAIVLYKIKNRLVSLKPKILDEVLAQVPRSQLGASRLTKGKIVSVLQLGFSDGSAWEFDVARQHRKDAEAFAQAIGGMVQ